MIKKEKKHLLKTKTVVKSISIKNQVWHKIN